MRKYIKKLAVLFFLIATLSSFAGLMFSSEPPQNYTGATGVYCTNCHAGNSLNTTGGSVTVTGLPADNFSAGSSYSFSITTSHSAADRRRFGFSIAARNSLGQAVGSFSSSNTNAALNGNELSHFNAPLAPLANLQSYTFDNLTWTAPANPTSADATVTFYYAANAANGSGSSGDFIYAGTKTITLLAIQTYTFTGNGNWSNPANWSNNTVPPAVVTGSNVSIVIDPPINGECVLDVPLTISNSASLTVKDGKKFRVLSSITVK